VGLQEAVTPEMAENPPSNRVLEALQELGGEECGFVETEAGGGIGWILARITLKILASYLSRKPGAVHSTAESVLRIMRKLRRLLFPPFWGRT
jgi:hypothetical protein